MPFVIFSAPQPHFGCSVLFIGGLSASTVLSCGAEPPEEPTERPRLQGSRKRFLVKVSIRIVMESILAPAPKNDFSSREFN